MNDQLAHNLSRYVGFDSECVELGIRNGIFSISRINKSTKNI